MSFTIMYNKDGVPTPIKLSIWDAFKGAPPPKPSKPKPVSVAEIVQPAVPLPSEVVSREDKMPEAIAPCSCCGKFHPANKTAHSKNNQQDNKNDQKGSKDSSSNDAENNKPGQNRSTREQETYTDADDKTIIELKLAGTSWKDILTAIHKESRSQLEAHWKQINPATQGDTEEAGNEKKGDGDDADAKKQNKGQTNKKQNQEANTKKSDATTKKGSKDKQTMNGELKSWSDRYDKQKWVAAASRHFDLTGERITPAVAKQLAGKN